MSELTYEALYEPTLPARYGPLAERLAAWMEQSLRLRKGDADPGEIAAFRAEHDALLAEAREALPPEEIAAEDALFAFSAGIMRAVRYPRTVLAGLPLVDTAGSRTLTAFRTDLGDLCPEDAGKILRDELGLDESWLRNIETQVQGELVRLQIQENIAAALDARFPLRPGADEANRASIDGLFSAIYPDHPLRSGEVEIVRTGTMIFFCIPFEGTRLLTRPPDDPDAPRVAAFLEGLTRFHPSYLAHFPSFGSLTSEDVPGDLIAALNDGGEILGELARDLLPTMVVVLPLAKIDQYLIHDAWGHAWQALLCSFEDTYQRTAGYSRLPELDEEFEDLTLESVLLAGARGEAGAEAGREDYLRAATEARLHDSLSGLNAEVLADVVEYKYLALRPGDAHLMPSSSLVKEHPTKLDLTLLDLPEYFERALKGFARLATREKAQAALVAALAERPGASGLPREALERTVREFAAFTERWLEETHGSGVLALPAGGAIRVNTFTRVALHYLGLHAHFNALYARLRAQDPDVRFADALVFGAAAFLELEVPYPEVNFWRLDGFLARFPALYARFRAGQG